MPQQIHCLFCQGMLYDDGQMAGQVVVCPHCRSSFRMPSPMPAQHDAQFLVALSTTTSPTNRRTRQARSSSLGLFTVIGVLVLFGAATSALLLTKKLNSAASDGAKRKVAAIRSGSQELNAKAAPLVHATARTDPNGPSEDPTAEMAAAEARARDDQRQWELAEQRRAELESNQAKAADASRHRVERQRLLMDIDHRERQLLREMEEELRSTEEQRLQVQSELRLFDLDPFNRRSVDQHQSLQRKLLLLARKLAERGQEWDATKQSLDQERRQIIERFRHAEDPAFAESGGRLRTQQEIADQAKWETEHRVPRTVADAHVLELIRRGILQSASYAGETTSDANRSAVAVNYTISATVRGRSFSNQRCYLMVYEKDGFWHFTDAAGDGIGLILGPPPEGQTDKAGAGLPVGLPAPATTISPKAQ